MLYLKNSLVNLTIILFSLFFLTISSAEESNFIFPKKKIITTKVSEKKQDKVEVKKNFNLVSLPQKKPFIKVLSTQKKIGDNKSTSKINKIKNSKNRITFTGLPEKKPISKNNTIKIKKGMILSNEPGFYKKNYFGIRIENLVYAKQTKNNLFFENLTLAPIEKDLINYTLLDEKEKDYLFRYHLNIYAEYSILLNKKERKWLASLI